MVRDVEQKKKGWFARWRKSSASTTVSRLPSGASSPKAPTSDTCATEDERPLPSQKDDSPNAIQEANETVARCNPDLPKHAGFDLSAMREMINEAKLNPEDLQVQETGQYTVPPIPPPLSESPPPLKAPVVKSPLDLLPDSESGANHHELGTIPQRSMSVNVSHEQSEDVVPLTHPHPSQSVCRDVFEPALYPTVQSMWTTKPLTKDISNVFGRRSFSSPAEFPSSVGSPDEPTSFGSWYTPPHIFTDNCSLSSAGLVFGSTDGSITFSSAAVEEQDPWDSRLARIKVAGTVLSNQDGSTAKDVGLAVTVEPMVPKSAYFS